MRLVRGVVRRLVRRPATWVTLLLLLALLGLIDLALIAAGSLATDPQATIAARLFVTFPTAYVTVLSTTLGIAGLLAVAYGAAVAGAEWGWGTLKSSIARGESRIRYTLLGYVGTMLLALVGVLLAYLVGVAMSIVGAVALDVPLDGVGDAAALGNLVQLLGRAGVAIAMNVALGYAVATVTRSQLAGIVVAIGLNIAESVAIIFLPQVVKWFPFSAAQAAVPPDPGLSGGITITSLDPNVALLVTIGWLAASLAVAAWWTERAEIAG